MEESLILAYDDVAVTAELCRKSYYEFFKEFWDTIEAVELICNWHIEYICNQLQDIYETWERGESQPDVIINVPPGSSKSTMVTQLYPAWLWVRNPSIRIISSSYAADLSIAHAVKSRDCLKSDKFQQYYPNRIVFKEDSDGKTNYKNLAKGERFATSTAGRVTGMHGDFLLNDDPINPEEANSDKARATAVRFSGRTLSTRKTDKKRSVSILLMQRLHEDDPTGDWKKKKKQVRHICLPGELTKDVNPPHLRDKYQDGLLDVHRLDREALKKLKEDLGSYGYAGQILQSPAPDEGGILKKVWFDIVDMPQLPSPPVIDFVIDTAYTDDKEENDESAIIPYFIHDHCLYLTDAFECWEEFPELVKTIPSYISSKGYTRESRVYVEPKASGKSAVQQLKRTTTINIIEDKPPTESKETRARNASPTMEAKRVKLIKGSWNENFLTRIGQFPTAKNKGLVDCLSMAVNKLHITKRKLHIG